VGYVYRGEMRINGVMVQVRQGCWRDRDQTTLRIVTEIEPQLFQ